jgi:hypothetical protein
MKKIELVGISLVQDFAFQLIRMTEKTWNGKKELTYGAGYIDALKHICVFIDGMKQTGGKK